MQLEEEKQTQAIRVETEDYWEKQYAANFDWLSLDDFEEDREVLLAEFKASLNYDALNPNGKDLEKGMLPPNKPKLPPMTSDDIKMAKN